MTERDLERILHQSVQDVHLSDEARRRIRLSAKEERPVRMKKSVAIALALVLMLTTTAAVAAELGLFGLIGQKENSDIRLPALDAASTPVGKVFTTPEGVTVTIDQAYYDGRRVFVSYTVAGPTQTAVLGEGKPEHMINYTWDMPGVIFANEFPQNTEEGRKMAAWLDGSAPRWAQETRVYVGDNMDMADGTNMNIIGGGDENVYQPDGSYINWKECEVPADKAGNEITVCLLLGSTQATYYQTEDCLYYLNDGFPQISKFAFTIKKAEVQELVGSGKGPEWTAEANLTVTDMDVKGEVVVTCPDDWHSVWMTWENPEKIDYIQEWVIYMNGEKLQGENLYGYVGGMGSTGLEFGLCYKLNVPAASDMKLVPVYRYAGEKVDEAIALTIAK